MDWFPVTSMVCRIKMCPKSPSLSQQSYTGEVAMQTCNICNFDNFGMVALWRSAFDAIAKFCGYICVCLKKTYLVITKHFELWHSAMVTIRSIIGFSFGDLVNMTFIISYKPLQGTQVLQLRLPAKNLHQKAPSNWAKWRNVFVQLAGAYSTFQLILVTTSANERERCTALKVDKNQCVRWKTE